MMVSVCILSKNAERTLRKTLDSVKSFPEVILLDNGSEDQTIEIASSYENVKIHTSSFIGFGPLRNKAASLACFDWILALDSDEILSQDLIEELQALQPSKLDAGYAVERHNFLNEKRIRGCGWDKDWIIRVYNKKKLSFTNADVHESIQTESVIKLRSPLFHTPYQTTEDFLFKMQHYSTLFAKQYRGKKSSSFLKAFSHASFAFFKSFLIQKGIFCGTPGWIISFYNASTTFYKYLKLSEANKK